MKLVVKQLARELFKNKIFVLLLLLLTIFTPFMYLFVHFSIDKNAVWLNELPVLLENQQAYQTAISSNAVLAASILAALTVLTGFVFVMFFFRFFKAHGKQLGCLKALGFKDNALRGVFMAFAVALALVGTLIGLVGGYFASDILLDASEESYLVSGIVKGIGLKSVVIGFFVPAATFALLTFATYSMIHKQETGTLLSGMSNTAGNSFTLRFANKVAGIFPQKQRLSIRLALRKPIAVLLILISAMSFSTMFIMGYSLTLSSVEVFDTQTVGHSYLYDTRFDTPQQAALTANAALPYLDTAGTIDGVDRTLVGLGEGAALLELKGKDGTALPTPKPGEVVVDIALAELYGLAAGDTAEVAIGGETRGMTVSGIAWNAKASCIYLAKSELAEMLKLSDDAYNGILSMENQFAGNVTTNAQKLDALQRGSVSNKSSAVINQAIGCIVGTILLYLALLLNIQDSTRDMLILHAMGYRPKAIKKMLINIYLPVLWAAFVLSLWPSIEIVKAILRSLSLQIGDYMPFQTNILVIVGIFALLNVVYFLVQATFNRGIRRVIAKEDSADIINAN